jgi:hypothetical protein
MKTARTFVACALTAAALGIGGEREAAAFDTFWHSAATGQVGRRFGLSENALNVVQFGNFAGPDFFGPMYDTVLPMLHLQGSWVEKTRIVHKLAIYMHFDDLNEGLEDDAHTKGNEKFDFLFNRLRWNTQRQLMRLYQDSTISDDEKRIAILETLGMSLHMVQDFYSHSNWIHNNFSDYGNGLSSVVAAISGSDRAPTWFEVRASLGDPGCWPFKVQSGVYPPPPGGSPTTHSHMNHDNSQLIYPDEDEGGHQASEVVYHMAGPRSAATSGQRLHQLFAINTAADASVEWVGLLESPFAPGCPQGAAPCLASVPSAQPAIDFAKSWDIGPAMLAHLTGGLHLTLLLSCAKGKWDGGYPPSDRRNQCRGGAYAPVVVAGVVGAGALGLPGAGVGVTAVAASDVLTEFWGDIVDLKLVEALAEGLGSRDTDDYTIAVNQFRIGPPNCHAAPAASPGH